MEISTGPWIIFDQADMGPCTILNGKINGTTVNFTTDHHSFFGLVLKFNRIKDYFGVIPDIWTLPVFLVLKVLDKSKPLLPG